MGWIKIVVLYILASIVYFAATDQFGDTYNLSTTQECFDPIIGDICV